MQQERNRFAESLKVEKEKSLSLSFKVSELQADYERVLSEKRKINTEFEIFKRDAAMQIEDNEVVMEELSDQLRQNNGNSLLRKGSLTERIILMEDEIDRLKSENRNLREENRDYQAQILHDSVQCGQSLLAAADQPSLAAELNGMDSQGVCVFQIHFSKYFLFCFSANECFKRTRDCQSTPSKLRQRDSDADHRATSRHSRNPH